MDAPAVQYVTTSDGYNIACTVRGAGRPLVFIPFWFNSVQYTWNNPWFEALASRFGLVNYDSHGQGLSTRHLPETTSVEDFQRDLEAVVEHLQLERFILSAASINGHVAVRYAIAHPEKVEALILHCCPIDGAIWPQALFDLIDEDWNLYLRTRLPAIWGPWSLDRSKEMTTAADYKVRVHAFRGSRIEDALPRLVTPTLLLHARDLVDIRQEESVKLAARIANSRLALIDGASWLGDLAQGLRAIDDFLAGLPPREEQSPDRPSPSPANLSAREIEVMRLLAAGRSNQQIADELVISLNTVRRHVSNVFDKTGVANRTEASVYARDHGIS
ncbi:MAG TPA: alpha/beta fold hydrolase [Dehalococcoidia bacterium]|nr:alpha/beta fold hydrolase [Dehalococcoidia bacterium]